MDHLFDEFSRSLARQVPRRESLRRLGAVLAGTRFSRARGAWGPPGRGGADPRAAFCKCRNTAQQTKCLAACKACKGNTGRIGGSCGSHTCCSIASCRGACSNLKSDPNCGACGHNCRALGATCCGGSLQATSPPTSSTAGGAATRKPPPGPYAYVACVSGACVYNCVAGAPRLQQYLHLQ